MNHLIDFVSWVYTWLDSIEWVARLVVRLAVGLEFFGSGLGKLGRLTGLIQYFRSLGIPGAELLAPFVASTALVCGALIAVGLATRPAAVMLCGVMIVGGLSGQIALRGTGSGGAAAAVGALILVIGIARIASASKQQS